MKGRTEGRTVTTAVIVAAGRGTRLAADEAPPKPLVPLVGVPLVKRVMRAAARAGITRFVVVTGFRHDLMAAELPGLVPPGCALEIVENPRFDEPNGVSLLAAAERTEEPFALLMSDHIFSPERLSRALERFSSTGRCTLVVEDRAAFDGDIEDATLVATSEGRVKSIGKGLDEYDAVDTGMFVLTPGRTSEALRKAARKGGPGISDGMRVLAAAGELDALPLSAEDGYWQDVDTPEDVRRAEAKLYGSLTKPTDGPLARLINRRISVYLSSRLWRHGVGPNMVTAFTLVLGVLAGLAFSRGGGVGWGLAGATLFQLQSIIDGVDGELARLLARESRFGFWFDVTVDNITHMAVFGGLALGQISDGRAGPWAALGVLSVLGVAAGFIVMAPLLNPARGGGGGGALGSVRGRLRRMVEGVSRRDFTYILFPAAVAGLLGEFLWLVAIGTWVYAAAVAYLRLKARREAG